MKTINSSKAAFAQTARNGALISLLALAPLALHAQTTNLDPTPDTPATQRPAETDKTSRQLIKNHLTVAGGKQAYIDLKNLVATGTIVEAGKLKSFHLIETQDGRRQLTYTWKHLGRHYQTLYSYDGVIAWKQELLPKKKHPDFFNGRDSTHFARQRWLIQPFVVPLKADFIFKYQGEAKVGGRPSYLITGYGKQNARSWFYFDKEKSLLTRWGGKGIIGGIEEYMDYRATRFAKVNGVLLPLQIDLLAENAPFGTITFETITANEPIDAKIFYMPPSTIPTLRQKIVQ
jgi:hypothetical protein